MKIEYVRNMQFGYMRLFLANPLEKIEEEMLSQNDMEGILPVCWQQENDKYILRYDITGKQALDGMLENTMADERLLKSLLVGIHIVVRQLEKHLLSQNGLLLQPETIFWDYKTETMHFCYCPEKTGTLQEQFMKLMEYMLVKTDHKNIGAVQLAYGVYEEAQKPSFYMKDLEACLSGHRYASEGDGAYEVEIQEEFQETVCDMEMPTQSRNLGKLRDLEEWKQKMVAWLKGKIIKRKKGSDKEKPVVYEMPAESSEEAATTILGTLETNAKGVLKYEGTNFLPDIFINKLPFVIGSSDCCDGIIKHPNISHYHARITYQEATYFIEDLNSTNGTRVNGGMLSYKTKVGLRKNESIYFANEPYRFL